MVRDFLRCSALRWFACLGLMLGGTGGLEAVTSSSREFGQAQAWVKANFSSSGSRVQVPPFSFTYDGKPSRELLKGWRFEVGSESHQGTGRQQLYTYTDPTTGLEVRCVVVAYADDPVVEWTVYFRNTGTKNTPILQNIQGLDTRFERGHAGEFVLRYNSGDWCREYSYEPHSARLNPGTSSRSPRSADDRPMAPSHTTTC